MSLDVYLIDKVEEVECQCSCGHCHTTTETKYHYNSNITHNLGRMAEAAGIYKHLWRPEEIGITTAHQLIEPLTEGLKKLRADPVFYKQYNASNGWGTYNDFVPWVAEYLRACIEHPEAEVEASR